MFKKGQLVYGLISRKYYVALGQNGGRLTVRSISTGSVGWTDPRRVTLIGNNYTAKDSKESAPANPGF